MSHGVWLEGTSLDREVEGQAVSFTQCPELVLARLTLTPSGAMLMSIPEV
jgi:hypothetical protein